MRGLRFAGACLSHADSGTAPLLCSEASGSQAQRADQRSWPALVARLAAFEPCRTGSPRARALGSQAHRRAARRSAAWIAGEASHRGVATIHGDRPEHTREQLQAIHPACLADRWGGARVEFVRPHGRANAKRPKTTQCRVSPAPRRRGQARACRRAWGVLLHWSRPSIAAADSWRPLRSSPRGASVPTVQGFAAACSAHVPGSRSQLDLTGLSLSLHRDGLRVGRLLAGQSSQLCKGHPADAGHAEGELALPAGAFAHGRRRSLSGPGRPLRWSRARAARSNATEIRS